VIHFFHLLASGLNKLNLLNLEGCRHVTAACLDTLTALAGLMYLNLNRCNFSDSGCEKFSDLINLKILNLGMNNITNSCLVHLKGLTKLESLNLDSCRIGDEGLVHLSGDCYFCCYTVIMDIRIRYSFIVMWL
jgi:hypothetical protein